MKRFVFLVVFFAIIIQIKAQIPELTIWNNIRNSSYTEDDQIYIRCETIDFPIIETDLYYFWQGEWLQTDMTNYNGLTIEGVINASQEDEMICRFKTYSDTLVAMMPAYVPEDIFPPDPQYLSLIDTDAAGDTLQAGPDHLDLLGTYFGYSDTRFYLAFQNDGSGFPTDEGGWFPAEYYAYITGLVNPENALIDTVGYALVYTQVPLFFQPGLYRFQGSEFALDNLQQIAEIETSVVDDMLFLAMDIEDLTNDEFFGDWPSLSRALGLDFLTASFNISFQDTLQLDYALVDMSIPSLQVIDQYFIEPFTNDLPVISDISTEILAGSTTLQLTYEDYNSNFPIIAEVITDQNETYDLLPGFPDFSEPVLFQAELPLSDWEYLNIFISDNGYEFVEEIVYNTSADVQNLQPQMSLSVFPNPFNPETVISFDIPEENCDDLELEIFNLKGQLVKKYPGSAIQYSNSTKFYEVVWKGRDENGEPVPSGLYFCRLSSGGEQITKKITLMK